MKIKIFNIALLMSICTVANTHASDSNAQQYPFSDYDRNVFTNHVTNKVELIYSTPFIESMPNEPMTVTRWELEQLIFPALTRIVFKQHDLMLRHSNSLDWLAQTPELRENAKRYWEQENAYFTQLTTARNTVEKLMPHIHDTNPNIAIPTQKVMLMVQYAARKIKYYPLEQVGIFVSADESQQLVVHGAFAQLLTKYRAYEQQ